MYFNNEALRMISILETLYFIFHIDFVHFKVIFYKGYFLGTFIRKY